jgi:hypothetical protein
MNYVIAGFVTVGVFIYLLHALPDSSLTGTGFQSRAYNEAVRRVRSSTRLSRRQALAISLGLILLFATLLSYDRQLAPLITLVIVTTSIWAAIDSDRVGLRMYKTRLALHPIVLFNAMWLLWPVLFPWYLVVCSKIGDGTLARKRTTASGLG